jgi:aryl-alcohol dehydrogenase-like predicted oxidoreductase
MRTRALGRSDLQLTTIGFGAWAIGGGGWAYGWGPQDDRQSIRAIHAALERGINWIDTAAIYGLGHSEEVVARALEDRRGEVIVATKCSLRWRENRSIYSSLGADSVRQEVEQSLRRLRLETIDLYQIHWPMPEAEIEEGWGAVADLVREGKVRYAGVSNFNVEQMRRIQGIHPITSLQPPYSMVKREVEREILPFCAEHDIGVVAYSPMQCGLLTGGFDQERLDQLDRGDWRRRDSCFREPIFSKILELVGRLRPLAEGQGRTMAQLAIAWTLRRPEVTSAIVGARRPEQMAETAQAGDWELDPATLEQVDRILAEAALPEPGSIR